VNGTTGAPAKKSVVWSGALMRRRTKLRLRIGSRFIEFQSEQMTVAARATAERKTFGHLS
jgi:hypothetical protein